MKLKYKILLIIVLCIASIAGFSQNKHVVSERNAKAYTPDMNDGVLNLRGNPTQSGTEDISKRNAHTKHFTDNQGNKYAVIASGDPIHYKENNQWIEIDNSITTNRSKSGFKYSNKANIHKTYFNDIPNNGVLRELKEGTISDFQNCRIAAFDENNNEITVISAKDDADSEIDNTVIRYVDLYSLVDAKFELNAHGKKLDYIIKHKNFLNNFPSNVEYLVFYETVNYSAGLTYQETNETLKSGRIKSNIAFYDDKGTNIMEYVQPFYYSSGKKRKKEPTHYELTDLGNNTLEIGVYVPMSYLKNPDVKFPVVIDPTDNCYPSNLSNWTGTIDDIDKTKYSGDIELGWYDGALDDYWQDGWAKFDVSGITDGLGVTDVDLKMYEYSSCTDISVFIKQLTNDPVSRSGANLYDDIDYGIFYLYYYSSPGFEDGTGWYTIDLGTTADSYMENTSLAADWFALGFETYTSYGYDNDVWLVDDTDICEFYGYSNATYKPYLVVSYCNIPTGISAGNDVSVCNTSSGNPDSPSIGTGASSEWSVSSGTVSIGSAASLTTPNFTGIAQGANTMVLTVYDATGSCSVTDEMTLTNNTPSTPDAGEDDYSCYSTYTLDGNNPSIGTGNWSVQSGSGIFTNSSLYNSVVSNMDVGANTFRWTITNNGCSLSDDVEITYVTPTVADAGADQDLCATTATMAANSPGGGETASWTLISGYGDLSSSTSPTTGVTNLQVGANTFRWIINHTASGCNSQDNVTLTNNLPSTANAGPDQLVSSSTTNLAGNDPVQGTGTWSRTSGTASITTPSSYNSGVTGIAGTNIMKWTISTAECPGDDSEDEMTISYDATAVGLIVEGNLTNSGGEFVQTNDDNAFFMTGTSKEINGDGGTYTDAKLYVKGTISFNGSISSGKFASTSIAGTKSFTVKSGKTFKNHTLSNDGTLTLEATSVFENSGDWTCPSTLTANATSEVAFNGTAAQAFSHSGGNFGKVKINNSVTPAATDGIVLSNDMPIAGTLTMEDGIIITGANKVQVTNTADGAVTYDGTNENFDESWVYGDFRHNIANNTATYYMPVGSDTKGYLIKLENQNLAGVSYLDAEWIPGASTTGLGDITSLNLQDGTATYQSVNTKGVWSISPNAGQPSSGSYNLHLYYNDFTGLEDQKFGILSRANSSSDWENIGDACGELLSVGYATRLNVTSFSEKGVGETDDEMPLPIELIGFNGLCQSGDVTLYWSTATEVNNDYFIIEYSPNGTEWIVAGQVYGAGYSSTTINYDYEVETGGGYYRLKQVDFNGLYTYFEPAFVKCDNSQSDEVFYVVNQNDEIDVFFTIPDAVNSVIQLFDMNGKIVYSKDIEPCEGLCVHRIPAGMLAEGIYAVKLCNSYGCNSKKVSVK